MQGKPLHDAKFLKILWDSKTRIIAIEWKETTEAMTDEDFKADLTLFAGQVEEQKARGILVDVTRFRHNLGAEVQPWRVKNISSRYNAAGVTRFAFLFPEGSPIPSQTSQSSAGENFLTGAFTGRDQATKWLVGS